MIRNMDKWKRFVIIWFYFCVGQIDLLETSMEKFRNLVKDAKHVVVFTGAGISAESGIPTFRGAGGFWRKYQSTDLATVEAFNRTPSLVWEFYHYRRDIVLKSKPNKAHLALTEFQKRLAAQGRKMTVITQNVDGLHMLAGTENVIEIHGSLFETKCTKCGHVRVNRDHPIVEALRDRGAPDIKDQKPIPDDLLPRCKQSNCSGLLRPNVVWFGENLNIHVVSKIEDDILDYVDLGLVVGSSSKVLPAAAYVLRLERRGVPVAEFNIEKTLHTPEFSYYFEGPCSETLPQALLV